MRRSIQFLFSAIIFLAPKLWALTNSTAAEDSIWSSVVMIEVDGKDQDGSIAPGYCTATLVRNNVLVTAAHCVNDAIDLNIRQITVTTGHYLYHTKPDGTRIRIGYVQDPAVNTTANFLVRDQNPGPSDDVAVIVLDQPMNLPTDFPFASVASQVDVSGVQGNLLNYWPTVVTVNVIATISSNDTRTMARLNDFSFNGSGYYQSNSTARVEPGDSGAPVFVRIGTQWKLLATVKGQAKTFFSDWDVFESLQDNLCSIVSGRVTSDLQNSFCQ